MQKGKLVGYYSTPLFSWRLYVQSLGKIHKETLITGTPRVYLFSNKTVEINIMLRLGYSLYIKLRWLLVF